jgi:hypothetical protein
MNERIKQLAEQAGLKIPVDTEYNGHIYRHALEKFAQLIVRECADTIENRTPGQMGKEGEGWTNGYDDGLKTSAFLIKKHFGVES